MWKSGNEVLEMKIVAAPRESNAWKEVCRGLLGYYRILFLNLNTAYIHVFNDFL